MKSLEDIVKQNPNKDGASILKIYESYVEYEKICNGNINALHYRKKISFGYVLHKLSAFAIDAQTSLLTCHHDTLLILHEPELVEEKEKMKTFIHIKSFKNENVPLTPSKESFGEQISEVKYLEIINYIQGIKHFFK